MRNKLQVTSDKLQENRTVNAWVGAGKKATEGETGMRVAVGLSGGVDSSVTAALLVEQGYDVTGIFLECWRGPGCRVDEDRKDALDIALQLGIPYKVLDFKKEYYDKVVEYFYAEYQAGRTPNPDTMCNREIKFGMFYVWAMEEGFDYVATGHYARITHQESRVKSQDSIKYHSSIISHQSYYLQRGADPKKDQSYFLYQLRREQLDHVLFPIGHLEKSQVRKEAERLGLKTAKKPDSQGICFIGPVNVTAFLEERIEKNVGDIVIKLAQLQGTSNKGQKDNQIVRESDKQDIKTDYPIIQLSDYQYTPVGSHNGIAFHTIGQKVGKELDQSLIAMLSKKEVLDFDPRNMPALFVIDKTLETNTLIIGREEDLLKTEFSVGHINWLADLKTERFSCAVRIRNTGKLINAFVEKVDERLQVKTEKPLRSVAPGQACVFYSNKTEDALLLAGGVILQEE